MAETIEQEIAALCEKAAMLWDGRRYEDAIKLRQAALDKCQVHLPTGDRLAMSVMEHLAFSYYFVGKYAKAKDCYLRLVALAKTASDGRMLTRVYTYLGLTERNAGDTEECVSSAHQYFQLALTHAEQAYQSADQQLLQPLMQLAGSFKTKGEYDQAEPLYKRALDIAQALEVEPATRSWVMKGYEELLRMLGRDDEAATLEATAQYDVYESLAKQSLQSAERQFGAGSSQAAEAHSALGMHHRYEGRFDEALDHLQKALAIYEKLPDECTSEVATALTNLSALYRAMAQPDKAAAYAEQALAVHGDSAGTESHEYARSLENLGWVRELQGDEKAAEQVLNESLQITGRALTKASWYYLEQAFRLSGFYLQRERYAESEQILREMIDLADQVRDLDGLELADYCDTYATALDGMNRPDEAAAMRARSAQLWRDHEQKQSSDL